MGVREREREREILDRQTERQRDRCEFEGPS